MHLFPRFVLALAASLPLLCSCGGSSASVQETGMTEPTLVAHLYPYGQHVDKGITEDGVEVTLGPGAASSPDTTEFYWDRDGSLNYVSDSARVVVYLPEKRNGTMIIVCPGGGYGELMYRSEGTFAARVLTAKGYSVAILCYRMPTGIHTIPITDARNAFRYCRYHAEEWGISKIGVMGMSAGGHLASSISTLYEDSVTRPDFTVLLYAAVSSTAGRKHGGSFKALTGGRDPALTELYSAEKHVTSDTPPAILFHSADDRGVKTANSVCYFDSLRAHGVRAEMYIFPIGGHGWGFNTMETAGYDKLGPYRDVFYSALFTFLESQQQEQKEP